MALYREYAVHARAAGLGDGEAPLLGGGSDASTTAGMGIPSILFSIVIRHLSIELSMIGFALVLSAGAALAVAAGNRGPGRNRQG